MTHREVIVAYQHACGHIHWTLSMQSLMKPHCLLGLAICATTAASA